jgi:hypothetical protein
MAVLACLTCHERIALQRGCCVRCFMRHSRRVSAGKTTWVELARRGWVSPPLATRGVDGGVRK